MKENRKKKKKKKEEKRNREEGEEREEGERGVQSCVHVGASLSHLNCAIAYELAEYEALMCLQGCTARWA